MKQSEVVCERSLLTCGSVTYEIIRRRWLAVTAGHGTVCESSPRGPILLQPYQIRACSLAVITEAVHLNAEIIVVVTVLRYV